MAHPIKWAAIEAEVLRLNGLGATSAYIAQECKISTPAVWKYLKKHNLRSCFKKSILSPSEIKAVVDLRNEGYSNTEISHKLYRSIVSVDYILKINARHYTEVAEVSARKAKSLQMQIDILFDELKNIKEKLNAQN